jgi:hypothetical protein
VRGLAKRASTLALRCHSFLRACILALFFAAYTASRIALHALQQRPFFGKDSKDFSSPHLEHVSILGIKK